MALRYFNKHYLSVTDLSILQKGLYSFEYSKLIDYGGNFIESVDYEKAVRVVKTHDLYEEFKQLKEVCKDTYIVFPLDDSDPSQKNTYPKNYEWRKLSSAMKRYINEQDIIAFNRQYRELSVGVPLDEYNRRLAKFYDFYGDKYTDDDFNRHVLLGYPIPTHSYKKAMDSARRAYKTINGLVKANIHDLRYFVTLTFAPQENALKHRGLGLDFDYVDGADFKDVKDAFSTYRNKLVMRLKEKGVEFKYICVWEQTKRNNYHFHLICNELPKNEIEENPDILQYDTITREYKESLGLKAWKHGKSDYQRVSSLEKMTTYLSKYILKSVYNLLDDEEELERYKGKKKYFVSKNLDKPRVEYESLSDIPDLENVYENETINPYNDGKIKRKVYTLIKKDTADTVSFKELE